MKLANGNFLKITELYAFVAVHPDGQGEGIMGFSDSNGMMWPMIGADLERVESLKKIADFITKETNYSYEIRYFKAH